MENIVLIGVDGSPESLGAAHWALKEASLRRWGAWFANVFPPSPAADPQVEAAYLRAARRAADLVFAQLQPIARELQVPSHYRALAGRASEVLAQLSAGAQLSVVGRRNRTGFTSRLGSVSSALAAHSHCPTAVIPHGHEPKDASSPDPASGRSRFAGEIVAAVEPGPAARAVLSAAADMARRHNLPMNVVTVGPDTDTEGAVGDLLAAIKRKTPNLHCISHTLHGRPVHEIAEAARESWLLVLGTRGISGLSGLARGSVSQALLAHVSSPVMVVPLPSRTDGKERQQRDPEHQEKR